MDKDPFASTPPHKDWRYYVVVVAYLLLDRVLAHYLGG
jgi:hypothetical protein